MIHRRSFVAAAFAAWFTPPIAAPSLAADARKAAAHRKRNILFNNDGDDAWASSAPATPQGFRSVRMDHVGDCGVDSVFYCTTQSFDSFTHDSKLTEVFSLRGSVAPNNRMQGLLQAGTDPLALAVEACRTRKIEAFWTVRMNDIHDRYSPELLSRWKKDNPQFLVGKASDADRYPAEDGRNVWTFVDFAHPQVRDRVVEIVRDVVHRYDVDGIDLDFMRHTCYFKETQLYQPATPEHLEMMTDMVGKIGRVVHEASRKKNKPVLLSARVFPTLELNHRFGFDVQRWVKAGYVDFVAVGGGYDPFTMPARDMIERGHQWGVPVYVCLSASGMQQRGVAGSEISPGNPAAWHAAAANAWAAGADGIMTFNLFPNLPDTEQTRHARALWKTMSDARVLAAKDKLYCIENLGHSFSLGYMMRSIPWQDRLPAALAKGSAVTRVLPVADDLRRLKSRLQELRLRVYLAGLQPGDQMAVQINGKPVAALPEKAGWLAGSVPPELMNKGANRITVAYKQGTAAELTVGSVELSVRFKP